MVDSANLCLVVSDRFSRGVCGIGRLKWLRHAYLKINSFPFADCCDLLLANTNVLVRAFPLVNCPYAAIRSSDSRFDARIKRVPKRCSAFDSQSGGRMQTLGPSGDQ